MAEPNRPAERRQRRAKREGLERDVARKDRTRRRLHGVGAGAGFLAVAGGTAALAAMTFGGGAVPADSEAAFGQHYQGLAERREAARVSTMADPSADTHTHQTLRVWVDGRPVPVPAGIGIDPRRPGGEMAGLHTHTSDGRVHNEGQAGATLAQFFAVWGVAFDERQLGPHRADGRRVVQMWVDGSPSRAFGDLGLTDGQRIDVSLGRERARPPA